MLSDVIRAAYVVLSLVIGIRLLLLYSRSRELPELLMAICLLSEGVVFNTIRWLRLSLETQTADYAALLESVSRPALAISAISVAVFAWRTVRAGSRWAPIAVLVLAAPMCAWVVARMFTELSVFEQSTAGVLTLRGAFLLCYVWAALEMQLYYRSAKRRERVGLEVDPLATHRVLFLSISFWSFAIFWLSALTFVSLSRNFDVSGVASQMLGAAGIVRVVALWLAFLPPKQLAQHLHGKAAAAAGASH